MKTKFIHAYMKVAETFAELSSARRLHVGAVIVKDDRIISIGYNGTPTGWDNVCEDVEFVGSDEQIPSPDEMKRLGFTGTDSGWYRLKTKPETLHAETNAIAKLAKSTESGDGATLFVTHAPCLDCGKLVYQSGIRTVFYRNPYRDTKGIEFLKKAGVVVEQINN
jgi:dCMP deaminase